MTWEVIASRGPARHLFTMSKRDSLLRVALLGNAAFSTLCAAVLTTSADRLSPHLSAPSSWLYALAAGLALFAVSLVWQATRTELSAFDALLTSLADLGWVLGSAILLLWMPDTFTSTGVMLIEGVGAFVLASAVAQLLGLRRLIAEPDPSRSTRCRVEVSVEVNASADRMWAVLADLPSIHRYSDGVAESTLRPGPPAGVGAVRQCVSTKGERWAERCTGWEPGRALDLEFLSQETGFPFPMSSMIGGWRLEPLSATASRVTVWWSFTTKPAWAELLIVPIMGRSAHKTFPAIIRAMATDAEPGKHPAEGSYEQFVASNT